MSMELLLSFMELLLQTSKCFLILMEVVQNLVSTDVGVTGLGSKMAQGKELLLSGLLVWVVRHDKIVLVRWRWIKVEEKGEKRWGV